MDIPGEMAGLNSYWRAEAAIALCEFTRSKDDIKEAGIAIRNIRNHELRDEARADLELAGHEIDIVLPINPFFRLVHVVEALTEGNMSSAHLYAEANVIIDKFFVRKLKKMKKRQ